MGLNHGSRIYITEATVRFKPKEPARREIKKIQVFLSVWNLSIAVSLAYVQ